MAKRKLWNPGQIKTIKQAPGSKDCLACVAAMITCTTPEAFKEFCGAQKLCLYDDFSLLSFIRYYGFCCGVYFTSPLTLNEESHFLLLKTACYLVVESNNEAVRNRGASHAVLWDGKKIHDPDPGIDGDGKPIEDYHIKAIFPLCQYESEYECTCGCDQKNEQSVDRN